MKTIIFMRHRHDQSQVATSGQPFSHQGINMAVFKSKSGWEVCEISTGMYISNLGYLKAKAIAHAKARIDSLGPTFTQSAIEKILSERASI